MENSPDLHGRRISSNIDIILFTLFTMGIAFAIRMNFIRSAGFPINDGGLFYAMVTDIIEAGFHLPSVSSYNAANIPFVYPPLPLYFTAFLTDVLGFRLLDVFQWLPLILSLAMIPIFLLLARSILHSKTTACAATMAYALLLPGYDELLMGGGLTRAAGAFFALLTLHQFYLLLTQQKREDLFLTILFASCTVLSHPVYTWFIFYSAIVLLLTMGRSWKGIIRSLVVAGCVLTLTSPWWLTILNRYGVAPFQSAWGSRGVLSWSQSLIALLLFDLTREPFLDMMGFIGLLGLIWCLTNKRPLIPLWMLAIFLCEKTTALSLAAVPLAFLVGIGYSNIVLWVLKTSPPEEAKEAEAVRSDSDSDSSHGRRLREFIVYGFSLYLLIYGVISNSFAFTQPVLSEEQRQVMDWILQNTPQDSEFLVVSDADSWWRDPLTEWFPALTGRVSLTTVQGYEWLSEDVFTERVDKYERLHECVLRADAKCILSWSGVPISDSTYILLSKSDEGSMEDDLAHELLIERLQGRDALTIVYDAPGGTLFK